MGSTTDIDLGLGLPSTLSLGSPFHTPTAKRVASNLRIDGTVTPPFSTPRRRPRGPSLLATSPGGGHKRNLSIGDVFARMTAVAAAAAAAEAAEGTEVEATGTRDDLHVVGFGDLPAELIQYIHLLADNPSLPLVSNYVRHAVRGSKTSIARYMLYQYRPLGARNILTVALKRPIVDLGVCEEMIRLWDQERGYVRPRLSLSPGSPPSTPSKQRTTAPPLEVTQLPRRLFRPRPADGAPAIDPLIRWLFTHWDFNLKGMAGHYPLARSVINQNYDLVEFLLRRGANPNRKDAFALTAAIEKKDLRMVKLLVEPFSESVAESPAGKRRKYNDRVVILQTHVQHALKHGTPEIVDYFVHEKGATPNLNDIMAMGDAKRRRES